MDSGTSLTPPQMPSFPSSGAPTPTPVSPPSAPVASVPSPAPTLPSSPMPTPAAAVPSSALPLAPAATPALAPSPAVPTVPAAAPTPPSVPAAEGQPVVKSRLLQNLQSMSATPFQDAVAPALTPSATPAVTPPSSSTPVLGSAAATAKIPQEQPGLNGLQSAHSAAPSSTTSAGTPSRKPATLGGGGGIAGLLKNKVVLGGAAVALTLVVLGGAAFAWFQSQNSAVVTPSGTRPTTKQVNLTYWGLWESEEVMQPLIDTYESQNPGVNITYTQQRSDQYRARLQTAVRDGSGPDIFRIHNTWMPMFSSDLAPAPREGLPSSELEQNFYPIMKKDLVNSAGQSLGVPLMYEGLALLYNQTMLESAGVQPPTDWNQMRELAARLTIRQGDRLERGGIALGTASNVDHFSDILALMLLQNGANPADLTTQNAQNALEYYTIFSRVDQVWDETMPPSVQAFANEQVAMILAPSWRIHEIQTLNPNLKMGVSRVPQLGGPTVTWGTYWVEAVSKNSKQSAEAWKFLNFLAQADQIRAFHSQAAAFRGFGELYPRVDMAQELTSPLVKPYLDDALYAQSWYMASMTHDEGLNDQNIQYFVDAVNATNQNGNAQRALQQIAPGVQQVLTKFGVAVDAPPPVTQ